MFDFGGTLDADGVHWAPRFYTAYQTAGGKVAYPEFEAVFRATDGKLERDQRVRTMGFRALIDAQVQLLRELLPDGAIDWTKIATQFHADAVAVVARNRPLLERLSMRFRLGIVSNFAGNLDPCLDELDILRYFTVTADSTVVGIAKPDLRIFESVLALLHALPSRVWMVGDNFETDIRPAGALGMRTCWLAALERPNPKGPAPTVRIAQLTDLEGALCTD